MTTKDKLEELFEKSRMDMEDIQLPEGHRERFLKKLEAKPSFIQRVKAWLSDNTAGRRAAWAIAPALCILALVLFLGKDNSEASLRQMESGYVTSLQALGNQLLEEGGNLSDPDLEDLSYSISSIISDEDGLMALQLPDNLSKKEKQKIIKEYYNQKMEGLKKIQTFIAMNGETE
ncbi:MAG: hypothetical protein IJK74_04625 [Bacteroidales bacterium]|nr:hypothetical protein [Bacteroidales bacterium]